MAHVLGESSPEHSVHHFDRSRQQACRSWHTDRGKQNHPKCNKLKQQSNTSVTEACVTKIQKYYKTGFFDCMPFVAPILLHFCSLFVTVSEQCNKGKK